MLDGIWDVLAAILDWCLPVWWPPFKGPLQRARELERESQRRLANLAALEAALAQDRERRP